MFDGVMLLGVSCSENRKKRDFCKDLTGEKTKKHLLVLDFHEEMDHKIPGVSIAKLRITQ